MGSLTLMVCMRNISDMVVGVSRAAQRLGVGERRIRALIESGLLKAERVSGIYLVDEDSLDSLAVLDSRPHVRAFSRRIAWAAAELADGGRAAFISDAERSRLRARLSGTAVSAATWVHRLRDRAATTGHFRAGPPQVVELLADTALVLGGASASNGVGERLVATDTAELWVSGDDELAASVNRHGLLPSRTGNVIVRCASVSELTQLTSDGQNVYRLIVAADLLDSKDSRARSAGVDLLAAIQDEQRWLRR